MPESKSVTSKRDLRISIAGIKLDRWIPFLYNSSGCRLYGIENNIRRSGESGCALTLM